MRIDPHKNYYKLSSAEDVLTAYFVSTAKKLKGRVVQEKEAPWDFWWEVINPRKFFETDDDSDIGSVIPDELWKYGTPKSKLRLFSWSNLIRRAAIKPDPSDAIAQEIILMTTDKNIFYDVIRKHFYLQKGSMQFAIYSAMPKYYLLKINNPSLWVLTTIKSDDFFWFNRVGTHRGLYITKGFKLRNFNENNIYNKLNFAENCILLVNKDGSLLSLKPNWKEGDNIVNVNIAHADIKQVDPTKKVSIVPHLRQTNTKFPAVFWKIEDKQRLKNILSAQSTDFFDNFIAWYKADGTIFLKAKSSELSRDVTRMLSDAFSSYYSMDSNTYVPINMVLSPKLSAEKLRTLLGAAGKDNVCIDSVKDKKEVFFEVLNHGDGISLEDLIVLELENTVKNLQGLKPTWTHSFRELKKKKIAIEVESPVISYDDPFKAKSDKNQVLKGIGKGQAEKSSFLNFSLNLNDLSFLNSSQRKTATFKLNEIDKKLLNNPFNERLWRKRGEIALSMKMPYSFVAASLHSGVLSKDTGFLIDSTLKYCSTTKELSNLMEDEVNEVNRGRLLAAIRNKGFTAEVHYVLLLIYGAKFDDINIFKQAIEGMKTGFSGENRKFFEFAEARASLGTDTHGENRVELLSKKDLPKIRSNLGGFMRNIGGCSNIVALTAAKLQLRAMLTVHLDEETATELLGKINSSPTLPDYHQISNYNFDEYVGSRAINKRIFNVPNKFCEYLLGWEDIEITNDEPYEVKRWASLFTMKKIRETPLKDFFSGTMYTPPFYFEIKNEKNRDGLLHICKWLEDSVKEYKSDGKEIAKLIYKRFVDGYDDWNKYFSYALGSNSFKIKAQAQRLLLLIVAEYGPHPNFTDYIEPLKITSRRNEIWDIYRLTLYCDIFRLCLVYNIELDQQRLFNTIVMRIPTPPRGWEDFSNTAEWVVLCLLLTSSNSRRLQFDGLAQRAIRWLRTAAENENVEVFAKALTILSFIQIGILADLVPEKLELHKTIEKRKVSWIQHATHLDQNIKSEFKAWKQHYKKAKELIK